MDKISVYIIAYNEEKKIADAVNSVIDWADEVIVADSFSTDNTVKIAEDLGAKVVQIPFDGFGKLRNDALKHCQHEWIFSLDSDERCTKEAQDEILNIVKNHKKTDPEVYFMPRKNYVLGRWVKHCGYFPDYRQPQLFKKGRLSYTLEEVHEGFQTEATIGYLTKPIWQFPFENLSQMLHKANRYSSLGAEKLKNKKKGSFTKGLTHGISIFLRTYFLRLGILDGRAGFAIALGNFIGTLYKYAKLTELQQNWAPPTRKKYK